MKRTSTISFIVALAIMIVICIFAGFNQYGNKSTTLIAYQNDWQLDDHLISLEAENYPAGSKTVVITRQLPDRLPQDATLFMCSNHNEVIAIIDGQELFCEGVCPQRTFGIDYVGIWITIPLQQADCGKIITLKISPSDGNQGLLPEEVLLGNRNDLTNYLVKKATIPTLIALFMVSLAIFLFVGSFLLRSQADSTLNQGILWLGIFILMSGIWMLTDDNVPCLFSLNNDAYYFLSYYLFMFLPIPFTRFIEAYIPGSKKIMHILSLGFVTVFGCSVIAAVFFHKPLSYLLWLTHVLIIMGLLITIYLSLRYRDEEGKLYLPELVWGMGLFALMAIGAMIYFYFGAITIYAILYKAGLLLFVVIFSWGSMLRAIKSIQKANSFEKLTQTIPCGICILDTNNDFSVVFGNNSYYEMFGYEAKQAKDIGFTNFDYILLPEDRQYLRDELSKHIKTEKHFSIETKARHQSGKIVYLLTTNNYLPHDGHIVSVLTDITLRKQMDQKLKLQETEFRIAAEQSDKYIMRYEVKNDTLYAHKKAVHAFDLKEVIQNAEKAMTDNGVVLKDSIEKHHEMFRQIRQGVQTGKANLHVYQKSINENRWFHFDFTNLFDSSHTPDQTIISFYDVTIQREKELAYERMLLEADSLPSEQVSAFECNLTHDEIDKTSGQLIPGLKNGLGFDAQTNKFIGKIHKDDWEKIKQLMNREYLNQQFKNGVSAFQLEYRMLLNQKYRWLELKVQVVKYNDNDEMKAFVVIRDIDTQKENQLELLKLSQIDGLTGIMNRSAYVQAVDKLIKEKRKQTNALVMLDVDKFKKVNDILGHDRGDEVLSNVANTLKTSLRHEDLLGRMGGDEFSFCLIKAKDAISLKPLLERLVIKLKKDLEQGVKQSVSMGVVLFDSESSDFLTIYKQADEALYKTKKSGGNGYSFYHEK